MPILYDRSGKAVEVPDEQVSQAVASGQYAYAKGQSVVMKGPAGETLEGPAEGVAEMLRRGYSIESGAEAQERQLQEEYGGAGGQIATFAHGAAKGLTFGISDQIIKAIGGKEATDTVKALQAANPDAEIGGELTGVLGSFLVPGGQAGALGKLGKLGAGVRKVGKIGRKAEKLVLKGLGGAKGGLIRQSLAKGTALGVGAGIEGAVYGAGHFLSEEALGNTEATAENLLANMKMGAMWGGVGGAGMGVGGEILKRGLGAGVNFAKRSSRGVVSMWEKATGNKAVPGLVDAVENQIANPKIGKYSKTMGAAIGEPAENIARFTQGGEAGREARRVGMKAAKERDGIIRNMSDLSDQADDIYEKAAEQMMGKMKMRNMASIKTVKNDVAAMSDATGLIDNFDNQIKSMLAEGVAEKMPIYTGIARGRMKKIQTAVARVRRDIKRTIESDNVAAGLHDSLDTFKKQIGKIRKKTRPGQGADVDDVLRVLEERYEGFRRHLENPEFYGAVGNAQKKFNVVWSKIIGRNKLSRRLREQIGEEAWRPVYSTNRGAMEKFVGDFGRAKNQTMEDFFLANLDDKISFSKIVGETFEELPAGLGKQLDKADKIAQKIRAEYLTAHKTVALQNQMGDIIQKSSALQGLLPMGAGAGVGYLLGGEEGLALGLVLSVATNPGRMIQLRAALDRMSSRTEMGVVKAIKGYIGKAAGKIKKPARGIVAPASLKILGGSNWGDKRTKDKNKYEAFNRRSEELTSLLSNPEKTMDRLKTNVGDVSDVAPNVATAMQVKSVQAARYLYDRMPKPLTTDTLLAETFKPSDVDLAKFERIAAVIDNPENALKSLQAGMLTVEEVDALKANYPQMYEQIVTTLAEQIPELRESLPYKERVQLSILFDVPVDATMAPEFLTAMANINMLAQAATGSGQRPAPGARPAKPGKYKDLSIDKVSMSSTQRVEINKTA